MSEAYDPFAGIPNAGGEDDAKMAEAFGPLTPRTASPMYGITERASKAEYVLREAEAAGLPMPGYVTISAHDHGHFQASQIGIQLATAWQVVEWAAHFMAPAELDADGAARIRFLVNGHHDVTAYCGAPAPQRCLNCGAREGQDCEPWCAHKPEGRPMSLSDVTEAACDTITRAAQ